MMPEKTEIEDDAGTLWRRGDRAGAIALLFPVLAPQMARAVCATHRLGEAEAEEIVDQAFLRVLARAPVVESGEHLRNYLWRTCLNHARDVARKDANRRTAQTRFGDDAVRTSATLRPGTTRVADQALARVVAADVLRGIPPRTRAALLLHHGLDYPLAEVADILGETYDNTKKIVQRGRRAARAAWERQYGERPD